MELSPLRDNRGEKDRWAELRGGIGYLVPLARAVTSCRGQLVENEPIACR